MREVGEILDKGQFEYLPSSTLRGTPNCIFTFDIARTNLVTKLAASFPPFEEYTLDIANGICTSCDEVYIVNKEQVKQYKLESACLKPTIRGNQFNQFTCPANTGESVLYITDSFDKSSAPNIHKYLLRYKALLIQKCVEKKKGAREWHVLFRARYPELFNTPKIIVRQTADRIIAAVDNESGYYCINSVNIVQLLPQFTQEVEFFEGILNSRLIRFFYREISQEAGRVLAEVKPQRIRALPICTIEKESVDAIKAVVRRITHARARGLNSDAEDLQRELDLIIYKLYSLSQSEQSLVESSA